jgi:flagellar biosynthesis protein FlhB
MFWLGILAILLITLHATLLSGDVSVFVDIPSILWVVLMAISIMFASTSLKRVRQAFSILLSNDNTCNDVQYRQAIQVFSVFGRSALIAGLFLSLIGLIALASHLALLDAMGSGFVIACLPIFYGLFVKLLAMIAEERVQSLMVERVVN